MSVVEMFQVQKKIRKCRNFVKCHFEEKEIQCIEISSPQQKSLLCCVQVELHERRGDSIPEGWGCDGQGQLTSDPKKVLSGGGLVPIGGSEATGEKQVHEVHEVHEVQEVQG